MAIFCLQHPSNWTKKCRSLSSVLKDPFSSCHNCYPTHLSCSNPEEEETPIPDFDDVEKDLQVVVSMIRSYAMEAKFRRKASMLSDTYSYSSFLHPTSGELFVGIKDKQEMEDFASVKTHFSSSCIVDGSEAYFSNCSSFKDVDLVESKWGFIEVIDSCELKRRAIIQEICHCEGWPFGLCRKALLLPPLPKSPSESWSWCKGTNYKAPKLVKTLP